MLTDILYQTAWSGGGGSAPLTQPLTIHYSMYNILPKISILNNFFSLPSRQGGGATALLHLRWLRYCITLIFQE